MTTSRLSCAEFSIIREKVIADSKSGISIHNRYPDFVHHMQTCSECRNIFETAWKAQTKSDALQDSLSTTLIGTTKPRWEIRIQQKTPDTWAEIECIVPSEHLVSVMGVPPLTHNTRSKTQLGKLNWLLVADSIPFPSGAIAIEVYLLNQWFAKDQFSLSANLSSDVALPDTLEATLTWGSVIKKQHVPPSGKIDFLNLPSSLGYSPIQDISLTVKAITPDLPS